MENSADETNQTRRRPRSGRGRYNSRRTTMNCGGAYIKTIRTDRYPIEPRPSLQISSLEEIDCRGSEKYPSNPVEKRQAHEMLEAMYTDLRELSANQTAVYDITDRLVGTKKSLNTSRPTVE